MLKIDGIIFKDGFFKAADNSLKYQGGNKKELITEKTSVSVEETTKVKAKLLNSKSERIREQIQKDYNPKGSKRMG